jgi:hypothetical protein
MSSAMTHMDHGAVSEEAPEDGQFHQAKETLLARIAFPSRATSLRRRRFTRASDMESQEFAIRPRTGFSGRPAFLLPGYTDMELRCFFTDSMEGADGQSGTTVLI